MAAAWTPWHKVVELRQDLRSGELALNQFAADLSEVANRAGKRPVYEDAGQFFSLTYPTASLRKLAGDVALRLAGKSDKAVRQLRLTYGGGKTHALIALLHLAREPESLPDLTAVKEFREAAGGYLPKARVAALCFDKIDAEAPIEAISPNGEKRKLRQPWSILAWQIAGAEGLAAINPENPEAERETPPFQELLANLIALPGRENLALLILIDELLMYARVKVEKEPAWRSYLPTFFQCLAQAASQSRDCCLVASLLSSEPAHEDTLGKALRAELFDIFNRQREEVIEPVGREDIAEILRRRFFAPESLSDPARFRPHVQAAVKGALIFRDKADQKLLEDAFLRSYPFHPDLADIFFSKWTQIDGYQKTRGALRTFALALRDAESWDQSPLIAASVFLNKPDQPGLSPGARELASVADNADPDGPKAVWTGILEKELEIGREIQNSLAFRQREIEQAVMGVFLHSQPPGRDAKTRDLLNLVACSRPDKINFQKGLEQWAEQSFWLEDNLKPGESGLASSWRLGKEPNLTQMQARARDAITDEAVDEELAKKLRLDNSFKNGCEGVQAHILPDSPASVADDGKFHFVVLGPQCASAPGKPAKEALRFLEEGASANSPRIYKNALIMLAPARDGLINARDKIRDALAWRKLKADLQSQGAVDYARLATLDNNRKVAEARAAQAIRQAWVAAIALSEKGQADCFKIGYDANEKNSSHFQALKQEKRARLIDQAVNAQAILPGGPYKLWPDGADKLRLAAIYRAFSQYPYLPRLLKAKNIIDTAAAACEAGFLALALPRPDGSARVWWKSRPDESALRDAELELWLPQSARLNYLAPEILLPGALPGLWPESGALTLAAAKEFFDGRHEFQIEQDGYAEKFPVPAVEEAALLEAAGANIASGRLWLYSETASVLGEDVDDTLLGASAELREPPEPLAPMDILPANLPGAWKDGETTAAAIAQAISSERGQRMPWRIAVDAISACLAQGFIRLAQNSGQWPCEAASAGAVKILEASGGYSGADSGQGAGEKARGYGAGMNIDIGLNGLQSLGERVDEIMDLAATYGVDTDEIRISARIASGDSGQNGAVFWAELKRLLSGLE